MSFQRPFFPWRGLVFMLFCLVLPRLLQAGGPTNTFTATYTNTPAPPGTPGTCNQSLPDNSPTWTICTINIVPSFSIGEVNVHVDLSGSGVDGGMLEACLDAVGVSRLLWGADITLDTGWAKLRYLKHLLSPEDLDLIAWKNAAAVFPALRLSSDK